MGVNAKMYGDCKRLNAQEEAEACKLKDAGDKRAFQQLVESVTPYAVELARKYSRRSSDTEDMAQVAILAVMGAMPRFDANKGRLTTFVTRPIVWALLNVRDNYFQAVHVPRWMEQKRINRCSEFPSHALPTVDTHELDVDESEEQNELLANVNYVMNDMPERWKEVVLKRCNGATLAEIGSEFGITKERVRQLEKRAIEEVRYRLEVKEAVGA